MEGKKTPLTIFLFLILVLAPRDAGLAAARVCQFPSGGFKGICFSDTNCAQICIHEGYGGGQCEGFRRRCLCQKKCP